MITEIFFFDDAATLTKVRIAALKERKNSTKIIVEKIREYIEKKYHENPDFKTNDEFYLVCQQYAGRENMRPATFIEHAVKETLK